MKTEQHSIIENNEMLMGNEIHFLKQQVTKLKEKVRSYKKDAKRYQLIRSGKVYIETPHANDRRLYVSVAGSLVYFKHFAEDEKGQLDEMLDMYLTLQKLEKDVA